MLYVDEILHMCCSGVRKIYNDPEPWITTKLCFNEIWNILEQKLFTIAGALYQLDEGCQRSMIWKPQYKAPISSFAETWTTDIAVYVTEC